MLFRSETLELAYFKGHKELIEGKITQHLKLETRYNVNALFSKNITLEQAEKVVPINVQSFSLSNELTLNRLEKLDIKKGFRNYLRILNNKIKDLVSKEIVNEVVANVSREHMEIDSKNKKEH